MPEGDTVWRSAAHLDKALGGQTLTKSDFRVPRLATADLTGEVVDEVVSRGKHLLMRVGGHTIHTHLKMEGSWHVYEIGARWRRPAFEARLVLETAQRQAVGFALGVVELVDRAKEDTVVGHLGPDLLGADWDLREAVRRVAARPDVPIFTALHDQRNLAGLGNVYVNELCFLSGVLPTRPVGEIDRLTRVIGRAQQMIRANRDRVERTMTGSTKPGATSFVFARDAKPCRRCGTRIRSARLGPVPTQQRDCYWCPHCQS